MSRALQSQKLIARKRRKLFVIIFLSFCLVSMAISGPIALSRADFITISEVEVAGSEIVDATLIEELVYTELEGKYWYVFPKKSTILYPKQVIKSALLKNFPRLKSVDISLDGLKKLNVVVTERTIAGIFCTDDEKCFVMDEGGYIFAEAPGFSGDVYPRYLGPWQDNPIGEYFLDDDLRQSLKLFRDGLIKLSLSPNSIYVDNREAKANYDGGKEILFSLDDDPLQILSNLESVLNDKNVGAYENGILLVRRIDLRYGNKVILQKD
jgi:hypothetical protein